MLREIGSIRQDSNRGSRRWFQDEYFDLFVWQDPAGVFIGFQLCYERNRGEGAISWNDGQGFMHARVDAGEQTQKHGMTPILRTDGVPPYYRVFNRFLDASADWDPVLRAFLLDRLREYRSVVFGARHKPRRKRHSRAESVRIDSN